MKEIKADLNKWEIYYVRGKGVDSQVGIKISAIFHVGLNKIILKFGRKGKRTGRLKQF